MAGEGSIWKVTKHRADGTPYIRWIAQLSVGPRGSRKLLRAVRPTRAEAKVELEKFKSGGVRDLARLPLGVYLQRWLDETAAPNIAPNTLRSYRGVLTHLEPIEHIALGQLRAEDIEELLAGMEAQRKHQKVATIASAKTKRNTLVMLRKALGDAERRGHLRTNPAKLVALPRLPRNRTVAMTPETARAVLAAVEGDRYEAAIALAMLGLRVSEVLGLAWADVDLERAIVHVRWQLLGSGARSVRTPPKTRHSERDVPLPTFVADRLRRHRARQLAERLAAGTDTEDGLVFLTPRGLPVSADFLRRRFHEQLAAAGVAKVGLHELRHGTASLLAAQGVHPAVVQAILGHADPRISQALYTHVTAAAEREAMEKLGEAVG